MKIIIAGSRDITSYDAVCEALTEFKKIHNIEVTEIVSGTARGPDRLGERWAKENNKPLKRMPADWGRYRNSAGHRRNAEMAKYVGPEGGLVAIWDGKSSGTKGMIELMKNQGSAVWVHIPRKD